MGKCAQDAVQRVTMRAETCSDLVGRDGAVLEHVGDAQFRSHVEQMGSPEPHEELTCDDGRVVVGHATPAWCRHHVDARTRGPTVR